MSALGDPPRVLTPPMQRYLAAAVPSLFPLWAALAALFALGHVLVIVFTRHWTTPPVMPVFLTSLAVISHRSRAGARAGIERVLSHGVLASAVVTGVRQTQVRGETVTTVSYRVDGADRDSFVTSKAQEIAFLQIGRRDEVLWLAEQPLVVVPTFLIV